MERTGGMSLDRVRALAMFYAEGPRSTNARWHGLAKAQREHLAGMDVRLAALLDEGRIEKAMRWLGFMQGALWAAGVYTLDELKEHSRPDRPLPNGAS